MMEALFVAYLDVLRRRRRTRTTISNAESVLAQLDVWLASRGLTAQTFCLSECERYFDAQLDRYAISTVRHQLSTVRAAYQFGLRRDLVGRDPTGDVLLPALPDTEPVTYNNDELRAILAGVRSDREELLFLLMAFTGMRLSETGALRWDRIDFSNRQIGVIGKGSKFRLIPLHPALHRALGFHRRRASPGQQHVLPGRNDRPLSATSLHDTVLNATSRAGMTGRKTTSHTFRRTVASELDEQGVRRHVIDKIMGWAPRTIADRHYIRIADRQLHTAINTLYQDDPISESMAVTPRAGSLPIAPRDSLDADLASLTRLELKYHPQSRLSEWSPGDAAHSRPGVINEDQRR
jgi:site-specific recombinase XerD